MVRNANTPQKPAKTLLLVTAKNPALKVKSAKKVSVSISVQQVAQKSGAAILKIPRESDAEKTPSTNSKPIPAAMVAKTSLVRKTNAVHAKQAKKNVSPQENSKNATSAAQSGIQKPRAKAVMQDPATPTNLYALANTNVQKKKTPAALHQN